MCRRPQAFPLASRIAGAARTALLLAALGPAADLLSLPSAAATAHSMEGAGVTAEGSVRVRWRHRPDSPVRALSLCGDRALLSDARGSVRALDAGTGAAIWSASAGGRVLVSAAVGRRWVHVDAKNRVAALGLEDGRPAWSLPLGGHGLGRAWAARIVPLPGGEDFLLVEVDRLTRRATADGRAIWSVDLPFGLRAGAALRDGELVLPAGRSLVAYRLEDGGLLWGHDLGSASYVARIDPDGRHAVAAAETDRLLRLDLSNGSRLWEAGLPFVLARSLPSPGRLRAGFLFYLESGRPLRRSSAGRSPPLPLLADTQRAYVLTSGYQVRAFDLASGQPLWSLDVGGSAALLEAGRRLCIHPRAARLACVDAETGAPAWEGDLDALEVLRADDGLLLARARKEIVLLDASTGKRIGAARFERRVESLLAPPGAGLALAASKDLLVALEWDISASLEADR